MEDTGVLLVEPIYLVLRWRQFGIEAIVHMELVVARTADSDRFFGKVTHVMSNSLVPIESRLTGLTEPIRSLLLLALS